MKKTTKVVIIVATFLVLMVLVFGTGFPLCHSLKLDTEILDNVRTIFSPDSSQIAFSRGVLLMRQASGLCAIPDGGVPDYIPYVQIYKTNVDSQTLPTLIAAIDYQYDAEIPTLVDWYDNAILLKISTPEKNKTLRYYEIDSNTGKVSLLPYENYDGLDNKYKDSIFIPLLSTKDLKRYILAESDISKDIGLYITGNSYTLGGGLDRIIVSTSTLKNLPISHFFLREYLPLFFGKH